MEFVPYSEEEHKKQFYDLNFEYVSWVAERYYQVYKIDLESVHGKSDRDYVRDFLQDFTRVSPLDGIIYVIVNEENVVGMGALMKQCEGIGEIKRMYIQPAYRGRDLGKKMLSKLIKKGRELGFSKLRLETADIFETAVHLYHSMGFKDIDEYPGGEVSHSLGNTVRYMELDL
ncbi:MAG: GNAT family N-acetyltransferase [Candidatus Thorarchaeota archaeon]|nr:GNAT family N-acetyltransferase [Candidatus Thorarchaeota archaeon]